MLGIPYLLLGAALAVAVAFGSGWHYGTKVCEAKQAAAIEQQRQQVAKADAKSDGKAAPKKAKAKQRAAKVAQETANHATTLPDPPECALPPERVRNINAALGYDAGAGGEAPAVPETAAAHWWRPSAGRGVGDDAGIDVPGMREQGR